MLAVAKKKDETEPAEPLTLFSRPVAFRITDPGLWEGLQELIEEQEYPTTITDVMVIALREHLKRKGKYHPRPKKRD